MEDHEFSAKVKLCHGCKISYLDSKKYSNEQVFTFLLEHGVITNCVKCSYCGWKVKLSSNGKVFRCRRPRVIQREKTKRCPFSKAVWTQTFFHKSKQPVSKIFQLVSAAVSLLPPRNTEEHGELNLNSSQTRYWILAINEVFIDAVSENSKKLGGKDQIVELAEAKWKKYKVEEKLWDWAFGGIDHQSGDTFFVPVEHHNFESLKYIISQKINPGSIIVTKCTKLLTYEEIEDLKNSFSVSFVRPTFSPVFKNIQHHWREVYNNKSQLYSIHQLGEYLFKSKYPVLKERLHAFFVAAGKLYPPDKETCVYGLAKRVQIK